MNIYYNFNTTMVIRQESAAQVILQEFKLQRIEIPKGKLITLATAATQ